MANTPSPTCTAFDGPRRVASGDAVGVALTVKDLEAGRSAPSILIFFDETGRLADLDLSGTPQEVEARLRASGLPATAASPSRGKRRGPGRPKLGVVSKEVTLLPRHWAWLGAQRGGASATLRRLVDDARRANESGDVVRQAQDAAYRFMSAMVGDRPGFEEAIRALYRGERDRFKAESAPWPKDLRDYSRRLAAPALHHPDTRED